MFKQIKEFFNEWLEGWKIMDEEIEKGNVIPVPLIMVPIIIPVHKNWLSYLAKGLTEGFENFKTSASDLFNEWLE